MNKLFVIIMILLFMIISRIILCFVVIAVDKIKKYYIYEAGIIAKNIPNYLDNKIINIDSILILDKITV